jgi:cyanuric acid amidohydrolase
MDSINVIRIAASGPGDVSGLSALIASGEVDPAEVIAIMGKTEGNGCVNDFTREYATFALATLLGRHLELTAQQVEARVAFIMSGGTEGVLAPHYTVFLRARGEGDE